MKIKLSNLKEEQLQADGLIDIIKRALPSARVKIGKTIDRYRHVYITTKEPKKP
ncbi:MAG: hypothetical protein PUB77_07715 [Clostridiales bacterium]|nr:hypothetical protein [Clostridiales bacterium]